MGGEHTDTRSRATGRLDSPFLRRRQARLYKASTATAAISRISNPTFHATAGLLGVHTKMHRSLYTDGNILHHDISENNIIITDPERADGFKGVLIE